jgi:hypothetical protein
MGIIGKKELFFLGLLVALCLVYKCVNVKIIEGHGGGHSYGFGGRGYYGGGGYYGGRGYYDYGGRGYYDYGGRGYNYIMIPILL